MEKDEVKKTLEVAVQNTHLKFPVFQGVVIFGSFVTSKQNPSDLDLVPVLQTYDDDWAFAPFSEGEPEWGEEYYSYKEIEKFFCSHFSELARAYGYQAIMRTMQNDNEHKKALIHIESLVALDDLKQLKERLDYYSAKPENFIGTELAAQTMLRYYGRLVTPRTT